MNIILQKNSSEKNKMDKTLTTIYDIEGTLKDTTSIIDPVIMFDGDLTDSVNMNYMTIPIFNRSYFITNIKSIRNGLFEISGHVDVLTTYKSQIRGCQAIVEKQERKWNLYLNDGSLRVYQNPEVTTKTFPSGFNTMEFVFAVAGN